MFARIIALSDRPQAIELLRRSLGDSGRAALVIVFIRMRCNSAKPYLVGVPR